MAEQTLLVRLYHLFRRIRTQPGKNGWQVSAEVEGNDGTLAMSNEMWELRLLFEEDVLVDVHIRDKRH